MDVPPELTLTLEDIPYLRNSQLAQLTGTDPSNFSAWKQRRGISERKLGELSRRIGISKDELLRAFDMIRQETQKAQAVRAKADRLIEFLKQQEVAI